MQLITSLRTPLDTVSYEIHHTPYQRLVVKNNISGEETTLTITKCEQPVDITGCTITHPMLRGRFVIVRDDLNFSYLMFMIGSGKRRTFYHVAETLDYFVSLLRTLVVPFYNGKLIGALDVRWRVPMSIGIINDIGIERLNPQIYQTPVKDMIENVVPVSADLIIDCGKDLFSSLNIKFMGYDGLFFTESEVFWIDCKKNLAYRLTDQFIREVPKHHVSKAPIRILLDQVKEINPELFVSAPNIAPIPIEPTVIETETELLPDTAEKGRSNLGALTLALLVMLLLIICGYHYIA